jgi:hypothetical protein
MGTLAAGASRQDRHLAARASSGRSRTRNNLGVLSAVRSKMRHTERVNPCAGSFYGNGV